MIAAAALKFVCIEEPHWRSTVVPATETGQPAVSATLRPMFHVCSSTCVTQPHWMSSTSPGSTSLRSTSAFTTCADSSSPRIEARVPFLRPIGLRTASMISASLMPPVYVVGFGGGTGGNAGPMIGAALAMLVIGVIFLFVIPFVGIAVGIVGLVLL